ncbi:hypothetical protein Zmor_010064 [Zophobas morio]|uniref:DUF3421 domain-containing protein n=1 Tax=Zophobas morio TaxID=2755281 RepID=A0AA38IRR1_9CUCU|nr:hypothetical protein Zmor_010064 [Zophobas morio]
MTSPICLYRWVDACITDEKIPDTAFQIGTNVHGHAIYVGRAYFEDALCPIQVIPAQKRAYLGQNGKEYAVEKFEILCLNQFKWVPSHDGVVLPGALPGGRNKVGVPTFVGRVFAEGSCVVGTIHPRYEVCFYPHKGKSLETNKHEALLCLFYEE